MCLFELGYLCSSGVSVDPEIMPLTSSTADGPTKRAKTAKPRDGKATLLDQFVVSKKAEDEEEDGDIIMNEDGTMFAGNDPVGSEYDL